MLSLDKQTEDLVSAPFFSFLFFFLIFERAIKGLNSRRPGHSPYIIEIAAH